MQNKDENLRKNTNAGLLGILAAVIVTVIFHNMALGILFGLAVGAGASRAQRGA